MSVETLQRVARTLGAGLELRVRWRGEQLDRLLDAGHARLVSTVADRLSGCGWTVAVEVTFSVWGERGSIDVLAYRAATRTLLVVEVKTVVPDFQAMMAALDRKTRLAPAIAKDRGWLADCASRLLVIEEGSTSRDRLRRIRPAVAAALPVGGMAVRGWLRTPRGPIAGILFVRSANPGDAIQRATGRQRVRRSNHARNVIERGGPARCGSVAASDRS